MSLSVIWRDKAEPQVYEEARISRIFNCRKPKRYPLAIAFPKQDAEVADAVKLAINEGCRISIRSGGHSWPALSLWDDVILVDLGGLSEVTLDEGTGIVRASPSTTGKELIGYLAAKDRVVSVGHCPNVGLGGFLLGGGMGWNCNNWGWACEQIVAVDVVTARGDLIQANVHQNSDLFWCAKGAGPKFPGLAIRFHLQTRLASKVVRFSKYVYPITEYKTTFNWALKILAAAGYLFDMIDKPCIAITITGFGDRVETERVFQRVDESHPAGTIDRSYFQETNMLQELQRREKDFPRNRYCVDNAFLNNDVDVATVLESAFTTLPTKTSVALWSSMAPCSRRKLSDMAVSVQSDHYFALYAVWEHESDDSRYQSWVSDIMGEVTKRAIGAYVGEFSFQSRESKLWGDAEAQEIDHIRQKWDPEHRICGYPDF